MDEVCWNYDYNWEIYTDKFSNVLGEEDGSLIYMDISIKKELPHLWRGCIYKVNTNGKSLLFRMQGTDEFDVRRNTMKYFFDNILDGNTMTSPFMIRQVACVSLEDHNALKLMTIRLLDTLTSVLSEKGVNSVDLFTLLNECKTLDLDLAVEQGV